MGEGCRCVTFHLSLHSGIYVALRHLLSSSEPDLELMANPSVWTCNWGLREGPVADELRGEKKQKSS